MPSGPHLLAGVSCFAEYCTVKFWNTGLDNVKRICVLTGSRNMDPTDRGREKGEGEGNVLQTAMLSFLQERNCRAYSHGPPKTLHFFSFVG